MPTVDYQWQALAAAPAGAPIGTVSGVSVTRADGGQDYLAAWVDGDGALESALYAADGSRLADPTLLSTATGPHHDVMVATLFDGTMVASFTTDDADPSGDIAMRLIAADGTPLGGDLPVEASAYGERDSAVAGLLDGGFLVTYTKDFGGGDLDVQFRLFNANGTLRSAGVIDADYDRAWGARVAGLSDGRVAVVYAKAATDGSGAQLWLQLLASSGGVSLLPTLVADHVTSAAAIDRLGLHVIALPGGAIAVAWSGDGDQAGSALAAHVAILDGDGHALAAPLNLDPASSGDHDQPSLALVSSGVLMVGWHDGGQQRVELVDPSTGAAISDPTTFGTALDGGGLVALAGGIAGNIGATTGAALHADLDQLVRTTTGGAGIDVLTGDGLVDHLVGGGGNDRLYGGGGDDSLDGGDGSDLLNGGTGADLMTGGAGNDVYYVDNGLDRVVEDGAGGGIDTVRSTLSWTLGPNLERLVLTGPAAIDGTGNDLANILYGNGAANRLDGGTGADQMRGGGGNDVYIVDDIGDRAIETGSAGGTDLVLASVSFHLGTGVEQLTLTGAAAISATGNDLDNLLTGNDAANTIIGRGGNDTLAGGGGIDRLYGGTGDDSLSGGDGNDWVEGGPGMDRLLGGTGADFFVFRDGDMAATMATADRILDFSTADHDRIRLDYSDANTLLAGDQAYRFIADAPFHHVAGELRFEQSGGFTWVEGDRNGDGVADWFVALTGYHALTAADFVL